MDIDKDMDMDKKQIDMAMAKDIMWWISMEGYNGYR